MISVRPKLLSLQVFRGLAALIVLIHHGVIIMSDKELGVINAIFDVGWVGVDFFFVLSGFIIYYTCHTLIGNRKNLNEYLFKRVIRIYPLYWIITIGVLLIYSIMNFEREFNAMQIIKSLLLFPQTEVPVVSVSWSLVYELFFYIMFGLTIYFGKYFARVILSIWILGIVLNSFKVINITKYFFLDFIFSNNNLEFLIGCIVAYFIINFRVKYNRGLLLIGILMVIFSWMKVIEGEIIRYSTESMLIFGFSSGLIVLSAVSIDLKKSPKYPRFLIILGDASYSIYLTHVFIFGFLNQIYIKLGFFDPLLAFILMIIITIILGGVCYFLLEKPLLFYLKAKFYISSEKAIEKKAS
jgi:exopolysaccharide production protein ExoZ